VLRFNRATALRSCRGDEAKALEILRSDCFLVNPTLAEIKARLQQEFVVRGSTAPKVSRKYLGTVVLGAYTKGTLRHYDYAGSGFNEKGLKAAVERMKPTFIDKCHFVNPPNIKEKIQWIQPELVCEIECTELTADDQLRQTTFLGWRDDKNPPEVVLEFPN
jgi:bifunctional non-homologous end joining protein LigD